MNIDECFWIARFFHLCHRKNARTHIRNHIQLLIISFNLILWRHLTPPDSVYPSPTSVKFCMKDTKKCHFLCHAVNSARFARTNKPIGISCSLSLSLSEQSTRWTNIHIGKNDSKEIKRVGGSGGVESQNHQNEWTNDRMNEWMNGWIKKKHKRKIHRINYLLNKVERKNPHAEQIFPTFSTVR